MTRSPKIKYITLAVVIFIIEIIIALYVNDTFIRPFLGDVLVVALIYCFLMAVTNYSNITAAIATLIFSYLVEVAQYFQVVYLLHLDEYRWARIIIGTSFSWWDMVCYTVGFLLILLVENYKSFWKNN